MFPLPHVLFCLRFLISLFFIYLFLVARVFCLICLFFFQNPVLFPAQHTRLFHQASSDVYIIGASCAGAHTETGSQSHLPLVLPLLSAPHSPNTLAHSLLFMGLFHHAFLRAYSRSLPYASGMAPMKYLNNLSPPVCLATL